MDYADDDSAVNALFTRVAIDDDGQILIESRCQRCGSRMAGLPLTISHEESEHLAACFKTKSGNLRPSA